MTVSTPVKIVALAALAIALGLGGVVLLMHGPSSATVVTGAAAAAPATQHAAPAAKAKPVVHKTVAPKPKPKPAVRLEPGLPSILRHALQRNAVAVVAVYTSRSATDRSILAEARAGASAAGAAFVAANVSLNPVAAQIAKWAPSVVDPAVAVVRRPGKITFFVAGLTDRETVAQAAAAAR